MANENLLYRTGTSLMLCGDLDGEEIQEKRDICGHTADSLCFPMKKLTQHCKATMKVKVA